MSTDDAGASGDIEGLPVEAAVERIVAREESHDSETVRTVLEAVAEEGVVTWDGVETALGDTSTVVSTPETRVELAAMELEEAREAATPVADLGVVTSRLEEYEDRLETIEEQIEKLQSQLGSLVTRTEARADLFGVAADIQRVESAANELQAAADELKIDIEAFGQWLSDPSVRYRELAEDLDAIEDSLGDLERTIDALSSAADEDASTNGLAAEIDDLGALWFGTVLEHRTHQFMIEDVRLELSEFREWAERDGVDDGGRRSNVADRVDELEERVGDVGDRLDGLASAAWIERFAGEIQTYARELEKLDQPTDWGEVDRLLDERQATIE